MKLKEYISSYSGVKYDLGTNDCYTFIMGYITGVCPSVKPPTLSYSNLRESCRLIEEIGITRWLDKRVIYDLIDDFNDRQDGDIVVFKEDLYYGFNLCLNRGLYSMDRNLGLVFLSEEWLKKLSDYYHGKLKHIIRVIREKT